MGVWERMQIEGLSRSLIDLSIRVDKLERNQMSDGYEFLCPFGFVVVTKGENPVVFGPFTQETECIRWAQENLRLGTWAVRRILNVKE